MAQPTHHRQISEESIQAPDLVKQTHCRFCNKFISGIASRVSHPKQGEGAYANLCISKVCSACANWYKSLTTDDTCSFCRQVVRLGQYTVVEMHPIQVTVVDQTDTSALMQTSSQRTASSSNVQTQRESDNRIIGYCSLAMVVILAVAAVALWIVFNRDNSF